MDLLRIAARVAAGQAGVPGGMENSAEDVIAFLYDSVHEWAWDFAKQIEDSHISREEALMVLEDSPYEKAWEYAKHLAEPGPPKTASLRTAMKLTLKSEKGRRQVWDLDGKEVRSLAGDGHVETSGKDPAANKVVEDFIRGAYPDVQDYPKVGESVEIAARVASVRTAVPGGMSGPFLQATCPKCHEHQTVKQTSCSSCGDEIWFDQAGETLPAEMTCPKCGESQTVKTVPCMECGEEMTGVEDPEEGEDPGPPSDPGSPYDTLEEKKGLK